MNDRQTNLRDQLQITSHRLAHDAHNLSLVKFTQHTDAEGQEQRHGMVVRMTTAAQLLHQAVYELERLVAENDQLRTVLRENPERRG